MLDKDLKRNGYGKLYDKVKDWYYYFDSTLCHNIKKMRKVLKKWGRKRIKRGSAAD